MLLVTSALVDAPLMRIPIEPDARNGLSGPSQVMADKAVTVRRHKVGPAFGTASDKLMLAVSRALTVFLGVAWHPPPLSQRRSLLRPMQTPYGSTA
jgi:mRNA interferase MazF